MVVKNSSHASAGQLHTTANWYQVGRGADMDPIRHN